MSDYLELTVWDDDRKVIFRDVSDAGHSMSLFFTGYPTSVYRIDVTRLTEEEAAKVKVISE